MKKLTIFSLILTLMFSANSFAGGKKGKKVTGFQGTITYKISYEGRELSTQEETQMPNKQVKMYTGATVIEKTITPMGYYLTGNNNETKDFTIIVDMMGQKMYGEWKQDDKDTTKPEIKITKLEQTKTIAGYKCKKAKVIISKDGKDTEMIFFYTEELKEAFPSEDLDLGGIILQTEMLMGEEDDDEALYMITTATEIKKGKVKKKEYAVPAGATKMEKEKFMQMMGGAIE